MSTFKLSKSRVCFQLDKLHMGQIMAFQWSQWSTDKYYCCSRGVKLNFCSLVLQAALLFSYFQDFGSSWQTLCLLVPSLNWGGLCGGRGAIPRGIRDSSKHPTADGISRQVLAKSGPGSFPQGCPRPLDGQQACSHMDFMPIFARCGGAVRTNVGQLYQRSVILPAICTEDAGGRGWQREGEESSLLQVSGDIPIVTGKLRRPMDAQG